MKRQARIVLAVLLMTFVVLVGQSSAQEMGRYIVTIEGPPGPAEQAVIRAGGAVDHVYDIIKAIAMRIPEQALEGFARNPFVVSINPDVMVYAIDAELDDSWGVKRIGAGTVHDDNNKGAGVRVAIIDTGIDLNHDDLEVAGDVTFVDGTTSGDDDNGHGTHCAGIVAALDNDKGVVGVAPEADLYALKVLDAGGSGWVSDVIAAIDWAVDPDGDAETSDSMDVINMSLGGGAQSDLKVACDAAELAGLLLVAAAGNSGNPPGRGDNIGYPAAYESVIAVGATDENDNRARFSSTGSALELMAPGVSIYSTYIGGGYATGSGTSMASPHVAGTAALVIAANIGGVRTQLQDTADYLGDPAKYGYGLVDADEAAAPIGAQSPVANAGQDQTVNDADESGFETVTLDGSASYDPDGTIVSYEWDTDADGFTDLIGVTVDATLAVGSHIVTLTVTDNDGLPDTDEVIITVTEAGGEMVMYVTSIDMSLSTRSAGRNTFTKALATVTIVAASGIEVEGATVYGFWIDATTDSDSGLTDTEGEVTLESDAVKNAPTGTMFTFIVDDVVKSGWYYDSEANVETSDFITVP